MFIANLSFYRRLSRNRCHAIADHIVPLMPDGPLHILDFGTGNMWLADRVLYHRPGCRITGADVIRDQNLDAALLEDGRLGFVLYSGMRLPFPDGTFDCAIASAVMHHTADPEHFLGELRRVLKPGGHILLVEEMYHHPIDRIFISAEDWILNKLKEGVDVPLHFRPYGHYKAEFGRLGLEVTHEGHVRPNFPWKHHYVFRLRKPEA